MYRLNFVALSLLAGLLLLLSACSAEQPASTLADTASPASDPQLSSGLPAPAELPRLAAEAPPGAGELTLYSFERDPLLPERNLYCQNDNGLWGTYGYLASDLYAPGYACAGYHFLLPGLSGPLTLQAIVEEDAESSGSLYFGVANWQTLRWGWFPWQPDGAFCGDSAPYKDADGSIDVLLLAPTGQFSLWLVGIGDTLPPRAEMFWPAPFDPYPLNYTVEFTSMLNGQLSDGCTAEWDWNGDGIFDESTTEHQIQHSFTELGSFDVTLRITNAQGLSDTASTNFTIMENPPPPG